MAETKGVSVEINGHLPAVDLSPRHVHETTLEVRIKHLQDSYEQIKRETKAAEENDRQRTKEEMVQLKKRLKQMKNSHRELLKKTTTEFLATLDKDTEDEYYTGTNEEQFIGILGKMHSEYKSKASNLTEQLKQHENHMENLVAEYEALMNRKIQEKEKCRTTIALRPNLTGTVTIERSKLAEVAERLSRDFDVMLKGVDSKMSFILEYDKNKSSYVQSNMEKIRASLKTLLPQQCQHGVKWDQSQQRARIDFSSFELGERISHFEFPQLAAHFGEVIPRGQTEGDGDFIRRCTNTGGNIGRRIIGEYGVAPGRLAGQMYGVWRTASDSWFY